jgi:hypothetical protein
MCEECADIDRTIERYQRIQRSISDQLTVDRAKEVVVELEKKKAELHQSGPASLATVKDSPWDASNLLI